MRNCSSGRAGSSSADAKRPRNGDVPALVDGFRSRSRAPKDLAWKVRCVRMCAHNREDDMFRRALACTLLLTSVAMIGLRAETFPYDHMHLNAADPAAAVAWYVKNLGAKNGAAAD